MSYSKTSESLRCPTSTLVMNHKIYSVEHLTATCRQINQRGFSTLFITFVILGGGLINLSILLSLLSFTKLLCLIGFDSFLSVYRTLFSLSEDMFQFVLHRFRMDEHVGNHTNLNIFHVLCWAKYSFNILK